MKTLSVIKQEARVAFHERNLGIGYKDDKAVKAFIEETLDRLVDEIEKAVVPELKFPEATDYSQGLERAGLLIGEELGRNKARVELTEAFTRFKGEIV